jgi:hypothetical protein
MKSIERKSVNERATLSFKMLRILKILLWIGKTRIKKPPKQLRANKKITFQFSA